MNFKGRDNYDEEREISFYKDYDSYARELEKLGEKINLNQI